MFNREIKEMTPEILGEVVCYELTELVQIQTFFDYFYYETENDYLFKWIVDDKIIEFTYSGMISIYKNIDRLMIDLIAISKTS